MSFSLSARFEHLNTAQKLGNFKFLFIFHFVVIICSLSSRPLPARPLFLIVLHNGVKNIHVRKAWLVTWYRNGELDWKPFFSESGHQDEQFAYNVRIRLILFYVHSLFGVIWWVFLLYLVKFEVRINWVHNVSIGRLHYAI